jgi:hypothetical protein
MTDQLGSAARAKMAWAQAQSVYATSLMAFGRYNLALNGIGFKGFNPPTPPPGALDNLPSLQALFGSMDYFECEDCQSVYSPAAYLVDLLQYLSAFASQGGAASTALEALLARRSEIQYIALDCSNTNTTLPYIDLVNEILESAIAPSLPSPPPPPRLIDTAGTSDERRALPQNILMDVYSQLTAKTIFPITLPYDLAFSQTSAFLSALGTSLPSLLWLFAGAPAGPSAAAIASASLSINPEMQAVIDSKSATPWTRWGFSNQGGNLVIDPKTRKPFPATGTTDWITILSNVPILLNRTSLSLQQLYQLLEVQWVTRGAITLAPGTMSFAGVTVLDPDTDNMVFTGLAGNGDALDRANRFLRLWNASGLHMWELDWALEGVDLDDNFLVFLAGATAVQKKLGLPFQEVLSFWRALETRDVVDHLGDQDNVTPSTYAEVFRNPAVIATPAFAQLFVDLNVSGSDLSGANIFATSGPSPIASAISAALGLSSDDIAAILLVTTGSTNAPFKKATLNVLLQYQRLASSLSLSISDLILWIQLTQGKPFGGAPGDTIEFLRRLGVLQGTTIAPHNLDYLLNNGQRVAAQSSLAFTDVQVTAVLQSIHDAIVKLPQPINAADLPTQASIQMVVVNALATAVSITANVVTPLLTKTGALPLPQTTINSMLTTTTVQSSQFATLASAFTQVAMGAALFTALAPTESEFAFVVQNAATFGWLDPSALPPPSSFYVQFEALLRALKLDKRQSARAPKLFDVLTSWLPPNTLPTTLGAAIGTSTAPALAYAMNASPDDVTAIVTYLGATLPSLTTVPGTLCDMAIRRARRRCTLQDQRRDGGAIVDGAGHRLERQRGDERVPVAVSTERVVRCGATGRGQPAPEPPGCAGRLSYRARGAREQYELSHHRRYLRLLFDRSRDDPVRGDDATTSGVACGPAIRSAVLPQSHLPKQHNRYHQRQQ